MIYEMLTEENLEIVHVMTKQLIIRAGQCTKIKAKVLDENDNTVGRLMKIFGPVSNPYGLVNLNKEVKEPQKLRLIC